MKIVETAVIPEQVELKYTANGFIGIFARQSFAKGTDIYSNIYRVMPEDSDIDLITPLGTIHIDMKVHSVKQNNGMRDYYGFDSFMNHSCDATSISVVYPGDEKLNRYFNRAAKDIKPGDEITANYLFFDWDCDGHSFDCLCGSPNCFKHIRGFKDLDFATQLSFIQEIDDATLVKFVAARGNELSQAELPEDARRRIAPFL
ncbi:MAG: SET domain-containing protein [Turneriella sp.]